MSRTIASLARRTAQTVSLDVVQFRALGKRLQRPVGTLRLSTFRLFATSAGQQEAQKDGPQVGNQSFVEIETDRGDNLIWVTLNRPDVHNAFNSQFISELTTLFRNIPKLPTALSPCRAVVLTGRGPSFSAGADAAWMKEMISYSEEEQRKDSLALFDMFHAITSCPLPVIGRVNGAAMGGGVGLVAACDFAFATKSASFGFTEVKIGLIPAVISPFVVGKINLSADTRRYFLTGEKFGADEAVKMGLVSEAFATLEDLDKRLLKVASHLVASSPAAVSACKDLLHRYEQINTSDQLTTIRAELAARIAAIRVSPEGQEGLASFLEKRPPSWDTTKMVGPKPAKI